MIVSTETLTTQKIEFLFNFFQTNHFVLIYFLCVYIQHHLLQEVRKKVLQLHPWLQRKVHLLFQEVPRRDHQQLHSVLKNVRYHYSIYKFIISFHTLTSSFLVYIVLYFSIYSTSCTKRSG